MPANTAIRKALALASLLWLPLQSAEAASDPTGVWINDTGRGAIEIKPCGAALCGHVVWVKDTSDTKGCGRQIIGNAAKVGASTWDNGWIYSPEKKQKYDVELKPLSNGTLQVTGYAGTKLFSKTMIWKRAPADLVRCGAQETIAKADPATKPQDKAEKKAKTQTAAKASNKTADDAKPVAKAEKKPEMQAKAPAKAEPTIVPPVPVPAERPAAKPETAPTSAETPVEVARAEPDTPATSQAAKSEPSPGSAPSEPEGEKSVPQVHALPGDGDNAPEVPAATDDEPAPPKNSLDMGKIAKRLAELERETGYGLKKTGKGNCRLNVPYATINFPCKN